MRKNRNRKNRKPSLKRFHDVKKTQIISGFMQNTPEQGHFNNYERYIQALRKK